MIPVRQAMLQTRQQLEQVGIDTAAFEAKQIVKKICQLTDVDLLNNRYQLTSDEYKEIQSLLSKRCLGYPLQYLLGEWEFFGLPFEVGEGVLIPRPDTEILCEHALSWLKGKTSQKVIDLCSGSGCIAIVLDRFSTGNEVFALEKSQQAMYYLKRNVQKNQSKVKPIQADVLQKQSCLETNFQLIVSNPPYLSDQDMRHLQTEVRFEPEVALFAQQQGYAFYEQITSIWKENLCVGGMLAYEIGIHQQERVISILKKHHFTDIQIKKDLSGIVRVVSGIKQS